QAPWYMTAGRVALALFLLIIVTSLWRKPLRIDYDRWRILHAVLAVAAVLLALWHVAAAGYYTNAPAKRALWGGYTLGWVALLVPVRLLRPWRLLKTPY